jgi:hypothetical protein
MLNEIILNSSWLEVVVSKRELGKRMGLILTDSL